MLRKSMLSVMIAAAVIMALTAIVFAGTPSTPGAMSTGKTLTTNSQTGEMTELWNQQQSLAGDWARIEEHYNSMMNISDPTQLKAEMVKHQDMMKAYNDKMISYQSMWRKDMSAYQTPGARPQVTRTKTPAPTKKMDMPTNH